MFGLERKQADDDISVFVHAISSDEAFQAAQRLWRENARLMYADTRNRKEFVRFSYAKPECSVWLQRDEGRSSALELILRWKDNGATEVFVFSPQNGGAKAGDDSRLNVVLQAMLVTPSVVPAGQQK